MDPSVATEVVIDKISRMEPEHIAKKIIGYMYFLGLTDDQMIRLAMGPESLIHNLIKEAKTARLLAPAPVGSPPISPTINPNSDPSFRLAPFTAVSPRPFSSPVPAFRRIEPYWDPQLAVDQLPIHNPSFNYMGAEDPIETMKSGPSSFPCPEAAAFNNMSIRFSRNTVDYPVKTCHYFNKGFCKHGNNCRYLHGESFPDNYPLMFGSNAYELAGEDQVFSLEKLELEIIELLISRRGHPVTIASLPLLYFAKYGKHLQAEGYLTESQRHGKPGYNLAKLLARLKNSIRLIERPHGQHAVILAEDAPKYMDIRGERNDPGPIVSGSRQIYLTFPAESTFTEEDVSNYFGTFGPVQDVRIPCQPKRMFGFVTFSTAETAKQILSKGNPHFVCGARVLVKPYREKSKLGERKYLEKFDHPVYYQSHPADFDPELQTSRESSRMFRMQLREEQEQEQALELELETMRLSRLHLACKPMPTQSCLGYSMNELKVPEDHRNYPSAERFNYLLDVLNSGSTGDDNPANNCSDQESGQGLNLPDSPFASVVASSISAVM